jgi:cytochrome c553
VRSLTAYKTGERKNPQMSVVAPTLGEEDIANLAAYYASIKIAVQEP